MRKGLLYLLLLLPAMVFAKDLSLRDLSSKQRIVLLPAAELNPYHAQWKLLISQQVKNKLTERDLIIFVQDKNRYQQIFPKTRERIFLKMPLTHSTKETVTITLIGKDSQIKYQGKPISPQKVFKIIDAMPMRQYEMRS